MIIIFSAFFVLGVAGFAALASWLYSIAPDSKLAHWFDEWAGNYADDVEEDKWHTLL